MFYSCRLEQRFSNRVPRNTRAVTPGEQDLTTPPAIRLATVFIVRGSNAGMGKKLSVLQNFQTGSRVHAF
jgi:hypothetical protein